MDYKIWIASYFISPPPYLIEVPKEEIESPACSWKTKKQFGAILEPKFSNNSEGIFL